MSDPSFVTNGGLFLKRQIPDSYSADNQLAGYEIGKAFDIFPTVIYDAGNTTTVIDMTLTDPAAATGIALINHNLAPTASVRYRRGNDATFSTFVDDFPFPIYPTSTCIIVASSGYQYVQLEITNTVNIQLGGIYLGTAWQFPHNYDWGNIWDFEVDKKTDSTDSKFHYETPGEKDEPATECSKFSMKFKGVNQQHFDSFKPLVRPGHKIFVPNWLEARCHYGVVPDTNLKNTRDQDGDYYGVRFWEHGLVGPT